jgi:hypothetical protein
MSNKLEACCNRLKDEIKTVETGLTDTGGHIAAALEEKVDGLEARWKLALARCEAKREEAGSAGHKFRQFLEEKRAGLVSKYEDWKTDREIEKLEQDADSKERHAIDAVLMASLALLEAEVAILDALKARKIAVEVAG